MERQTSNLRVHQREVTPTDATQLMTASERSRIEASGTKAHESTPRVTIVRAKNEQGAPPPSDGVEYGFDELASRSQVTNTVDAPPSVSATEKTTPEHRRARITAEQANQVRFPDASSETVVAAESPTAERKSESLAPDKSIEGASSETAQEIIKTSFQRVLGTKIDLAIAFHLLSRVRHEMPTSYSEYHKKAMDRVTTELDNARDAEAAHIDLPYPSQILERALEYLEQHRP